MLNSMEGHFPGVTVSRQFIIIPKPKIYPKYINTLTILMHVRLQKGAHLEWSKLMVSEALLRSSSSLQRAKSPYTFLNDLPSVAPSRADPLSPPVAKPELVTHEVPSTSPCGETPQQDLPRSILGRLYIYINILIYIYIRLEFNLKHPEYQMAHFASCTSY